MKLAHYYTLITTAAAFGLWLAKANPSSILVILCLMVGNGIFQVWARGNVYWRQPIDKQTVATKVPYQAYAAASASVLVLLVLLASRAVGPLP